MTHLQHAELKTMLETRRYEVEEQVRQNIRSFRDADRVDTVRPTDDLTDDLAQKDLDYAVAELQAQKLKNVVAALTRLEAGDYGICHECGEEIPAKRLGALPFATTCLSCQENVESVERRQRRG